MKVSNGGETLMPSTLSPVSVFIMDVTDSTNFQDSNDLTNYLGAVVRGVEAWIPGDVPFRIKQRYGDEIIFVSKHLETAYIVASYIKRFWKYPNHSPYFGMTYGFLDKDITAIEDVDKWNHPILKSARHAIDDLKKQDDRAWLVCLTDDSADEDINQAINMTCEIQNMIIKEQTDIQQITCLLYLLFQRQTDVARLLNKSAPTISIALKKGKCNFLSDSFGVVENLIAFKNRQGEHLCVSETPKDFSKLLHESILRHISNHLTGYIDLP